MQEDIIDGRDDAGREDIINGRDDARRQYKREGSTGGQYKRGGG